MTYVNVLLCADIAYVATPLNYFRVHAATVRWRTKADEYYRESQTVLSVMRARLASVREKRLGMKYLELFVQGLLSPERRPPRMKVPLAMQPTLLLQAVRLTPLAFVLALRILARENLADIAYRVGLLQLARKIKRLWAQRV
jgi:hypothetical protein